MIDQVIAYLSALFAGVGLWTAIGVTLVAGLMRGFAGFGSAMLMTAVAIALPVTLVLLLVQVITGVLSRSAPALNLFALGLPAGVLAGIAALIVSAPLLSEQMTVLTAEALAHAQSIVQR